MPNTSNLNLAPGRTIPNSVVSHTGAVGEVWVTGPGPAYLIVGASDDFRWPGADWRLRQVVG